MGIGVMWPCNSDIMLDKVPGLAPFLIVSNLCGTDICQNGPWNTIECGKSKKIVAHKSYSFSLVL